MARFTQLERFYSSIKNLNYVNDINVNKYRRAQSATSAICSWKLDEIYSSQLYFYEVKQAEKYKNEPEHKSVYVQLNNLTLDIDFFLLGFQLGHQLSIFLFCLLLVVYCGTICGNLLIIALVSTSKNLHTPMYFFISQLSISDILLPTDIVPNMLHILLNNGGTISFQYCITQFYFFAVSEAFECFLLTVMSYDRYVAICNPLHYTSIMTRSHCIIMAAMCWVLGFSIALMYCVTISVLTFCGTNIIDHFFCDLVPLVDLACSSTFTIELELFIMCFILLVIPITIVIISYNNIIVSILRFQTRISRQKAFSTCSSHLTVVSIYYATLLSVYLFPKGQTLNLNKFLAILYTVFTPLINPIIYSLRNKEIKKSVEEMINKWKYCNSYINNLYT
ncbi:olfactory receptor 1496-like [Anomaloglossus baeobatrachus]|uniref:olfactory receptor 1496-like n=1 Tax=Anomaloglossus baeobatrachus TaxID=238106 RepID=UPI003F4F86A4